MKKMKKKKMKKKKKKKETPMGGFEPPLVLLDIPKKGLKEHSDNPYTTSDYYTILCERGIFISILYCLRRSLRNEYPRTYYNVSN